MMERNKYWLILIVLLISPLLIYFYNFAGILSDDPSDWSSFGSYVSGVYGALSLLFVIFTIYNNNKQLKEEKENNLFFRTFEIFMNHKMNTSETQYVATNLKNNLEYQMLRFGKTILTQNIDLLDEGDWYQLGMFKKGEVNELKQYFSNSKKEDRWEAIKSYIFSNGESLKDNEKSFRGIGSKYFYRINYVDKCALYESAYGEVCKEYDMFLDIFFKNLESIMLIIENFGEKELYKMMLKNSFYKYDNLLLFYYLSSGLATKRFAELCFKNNLLREYNLYRYDLLDAPSEGEVLREIDQIFQYYKTRSNEEFNEGC